MRHSICASIIALTALAGLGAISAPAHAQELVTNGGFEVGDFSGWNTILAASGSSLIAWDDASAFAHSGNGVVYFAATSNLDDTITQSLATVPGESYTFSFWLKNGRNGGDHIAASWNGTPVVDLTNSSAFDWTFYSFNVVATGPNSEIAFSGYDGPNSIYVDDVSVMAVPPTGSATAPEPASCALLALGTGVPILMGRAALRRKRVSASRHARTGTFPL